MKSEHLGADQGASALLGAQYGHPMLFAAGRGFYPNFPPEVPQQLYDNAVGDEPVHRQHDAQQPALKWFTQRATVGVDYTTEDARAIERFAPPELAPLLSARAGRRSHRPDAPPQHDHHGRLQRDGEVQSDVDDRVELVDRRTVLQHREQHELPRRLGFPGAGRRDGVVRRESGRLRRRSQTINTTIGAYAQQQFAWRDRVYLTAALRVDNNSAFGEDFKWVTYPEGQPLVGRERRVVVAAERARSTRCACARAYGESGRQPNAFSALRTFSPITGASGITPGSIGNPDLKPERGKELEVGFEANLWNRLDLDFTYFNKKTYDEILNQAVAPSSGFSASRP